jgi:porin
VGGGAAAGHCARWRRRRGLSLFANFTVHDKATNVVDNYQQVGLVYKGAVRRPAQGRHRLRRGPYPCQRRREKRAELLNAQSGINDYDNPGFVPLQRTEYNAELYYGFHVTNWLTVRPNLQYIKARVG